ncbi:MAG: hypothetical protein J0I57_01575, partial [Hyphomicrobium sp.]|nr:hypothetical protein [Hyphomicrobium sp.]
FAEFVTFSVVIFAAWYMMWLFQRVVFGRAPGELPDAHDNELTAEEQAELAATGHLPGGAHGHPVPAGGSGAHAPAHDDHGSSKWPDLRWNEALCLFPLAALTIFFGINPKPIFDIMQPSLERIIMPFLH